MIKIAYYALLGICALVGLFYFFATLLDLPGRTGSAQIRENVIMLVASGTALGMLYWAFRVGHQHGQWLAGLAVVLAACLVFLVLFFGGMFLFGKIHWQ